MMEKYYYIFLGLHCLLVVADYVASALSGRRESGAPGGVGGKALLVELPLLAVMVTLVVATIFRRSAWSVKVDLLWISLAVCVVARLWQIIAHRVRSGGWAKSSTFMHALVMLFPTLLVIGSAPDCIKFQKEWTVGDMPVFEGDPLVRIARDRLRVAEHMLRRASKAAGPVSERLRETPVSEIIAHVEGTLGALHWLRGRELFREAQYGEAEPEFHKVLELAPNNTVLSLLCICIIQRGGDISDYLENGDGGGDKRLEVLALPFDAAESVAATMDDNEDRAWAWYLLAERAIALREWDLAGRYAERVDELADYLVLEDIRSMWKKIEGKRRPQDAM